MGDVKTKYRGGSGHAGPSVMLDRHKKVLDYDDAGTDDGFRIVTLVRGWAFEDAAKNEGDDPQARMALHSRSFGSVKEALVDLKYVTPCKCGRCMGNM